MVFYIVSKGSATVKPVSAFTVGKRQDVPLCRRRTFQHMPCTYRDIYNTRICAVRTLQTHMGRMCKMCTTHIYFVAPHAQRRSPILYSVRACQPQESCARASTQQQPLPEQSRALLQSVVGALRWPNWSTDCSARAFDRVSLANALAQQRSAQ